MIRRILNAARAWWQRRSLPKPSTVHVRSFGACTVRPVAPHAVTIEPPMRADDPWFHPGTPENLLSMKRLGYGK